MVVGGEVREEERKLKVIGVSLLHVWGSDVSLC